MSGPLFSVIVPTYGRDTFLGEAVGSVLEQTIDDFECIVVDDGKGETASLPDDDRVLLVRRNTNGGPAVARNTGLRRASGRYVTFLDDDDRFTPTRLEIALEGLERADVGVCWAVYDGDAPSGPLLDGDIRETVLDQMTPPLEATATPRDLAVDLDPRFEAAEDIDWWLRMARDHRVATVPRVGVLVRRHDAPRHRIGLRTRIDSSLLLLREHEAYFRSHPRALAFRWKRIGLMALNAGDLKLARTAMVRSLAARPSPRTAWHLSRAVGSSLKATKPASRGPSVPRDEHAPLRVLWLVKGLGPGGAERLLCSLAEVADRGRFDIEAAYVLNWKTALVGELEARGVTVHSLGVARMRDLRWLARLRQVIAEGNFDVIHIHSPAVGVITRALLRTVPGGRRRRVVSTEHSLWSGHSAITRTCNRLTFALDDAHVAVSDPVLASIPASLRNRAEVIVHGVNRAGIEEYVAAGASLRAELGVDPSEFVVATVANFRRAKGYPDLLAAARKVIDSGVPVRFLAVGQGPLEREIRDLHHELGLGDRCLLLGYRPDAISVVAAADVFMMASLHEGFPVALMEALAVGVPVVATAVGGVPDAVTHGVEGLMVAPGRPDLLADAIIQLARDPERRRGMAQAAAARGRDFDILNAARRIEAIYDEICQASGEQRRQTA